MLCCCSRCHVTRSVYVRVCYATFALDRSLQRSHDQHHRSVNLVHRDQQTELHRDVQSKHYKDEQMEHHRDVHSEHREEVQCECHRDEQTELHRDEQHGDVHEDVLSQHHRSFIDSVHREVHIQLTMFLAGSNRSSMLWQPYVVTYYAELTTLCLRDRVTSSNEFLSLLSRCLCCDLYDIRLTALRFLSSVLHGNDRYNRDDDDDDDDDDDVVDGDDGSVHLSESREKLLCELVTVRVDDSSVSVCQMLVEMLMSAETHDECLFMVRPHTHTHTDHTQARNTALFSVLLSQRLYL